WRTAPDGRSARCARRTARRRSPAAPGAPGRAAKGWARRRPGGAMSSRPRERVRPGRIGDGRSGSLDEQHPRPRRDAAERLVDRARPVDLDVARPGVAETEDELRWLAAQVA